MSMTTTERLEVLKRCLHAARDTEHPVDLPTIRGMNIGLQMAIDAIDLELRMIAAGQVAEQHQ